MFSRVACERRRVFLPRLLVRTAYVSSLIAVTGGLISLGQRPRDAATHLVHPGTSVAETDGSLGMQEGILVACTGPSA
jgi:hypothetical protein